MLQISSAEVYDALRVENPWWRTLGSNGRLAGFPARAYLPAFCELVEQGEVVRSVILMGPRRVGKTVMILQAIERLLRQQVAAHRILYISFGRPLYNGLTLEAVVAAHLERHPQETARFFFFFDEIQYVRDWERDLKSLTDRYPEFRFVASGSAAAALRTKSQESGAGRFTDFMLPPLTYDEFIAFQNEPSESLDRLMHFAEEGFADASKLREIDIAYLNILFERYLTYGGYPEAVFSPRVQGNLDRFVREDIVEKVLLRDLPSLYGIQDTRELNSLFTTLCYNTAQEVSLEGLSKTGAISKNTIKRYMEYLEAAFLVRTLSRIDRAAHRFERQNTFKVYLTNPSLRAALFRPITQNDAEFGPLVETAIFSQWFHSPTKEPLHYARWDKGEVDMVLLGDEMKPTWFAEVKWSDRHLSRPEELQSLVGFVRAHEATLGEGLVTSRSKFGRIQLGPMTVEVVPAAIHCWRVGRNIVASRFNDEPELPL